MEERFDNEDTSGSLGASAEDGGRPTPASPRIEDDAPGFTAPSSRADARADMLAKADEIVRLMDEAMEHWEKNTDDGHCKSSEGSISICFGNYWDRKHGRNVCHVDVYSYLFGPHRSHTFNSLDEALTEVRKWHKCEMENLYDNPDYW